MVKREAQWRNRSLLQVAWIKHEHVQEGYGNSGWINRDEERIEQAEDWVPPITWWKWVSGKHLRKKKIINLTQVEKYAALEGEINRMLEQMSVAEIEFDKVLSQKQKELDDEKRKAQKFVKDMKADYDQERTKLQEERAQTNNQIKELQEALAETQRKLKAAIEKENESLMNSQREIQNMQQIYAMNSNPVVRSSRSEDHSSTCRCKNEENNKTKEVRIESSGTCLKNCIH